MAGIDKNAPTDRPKSVGIGRVHQEIQHLNLPAHR